MYKLALNVRKLTLRRRWARTCDWRGTTASWGDWRSRRGTATSPAARAAACSPSAMPPSRPRSRPCVPATSASSPWCSRRRRAAADADRLVPRTVPLPTAVNERSSTALNALRRTRQHHTSGCKCVYSRPIYSVVESTACLSVCVRQTEATTSNVDVVRVGQQRRGPCTEWRRCWGVVVVDVVVVVATTTTTTTAAAAAAVVAATQWAVVSSRAPIG